jgi:hypothetical protein
VKSACYYININADGSLSGFNNFNANIPARQDVCCVTTKNRVYLLGGYDGSADVADYYTATINNDGSISQFTYAGDLPQPCSRGSAIVTSTNIYMFTSTYYNNTYTMTLGLDGTITNIDITSGILKPGYWTDTFATSSRVYTFSFNGETEYAPFAGGFNDYSNWNGTITPAGDPINFKLPDTTTTDGPNVYTFIKY